MIELRFPFESWRGRRLWMLGVGNAERGDDGFGTRLVEELSAALRHDGAPVRFIDVGTCPERYVGEAARAGCQELVFADAVDFGGAPGALLLADTEDLLKRPVATSAHRVPLPVLAQYAQGLGVRAWLLGVQPASLAAGAGLSPEASGTLVALVQILGQALAVGRPAHGAPAPAGFDPSASSGLDTSRWHGVDP
jgi:hydrogenase maturation protease